VRAAVGLEAIEPPKPSQRWRLIQAMIELSAKAGHNGVPIAELCTGAGVSAAAFYVEFADREELLVAAYRHCAERVFGPMRATLLEAEISDVPTAAVSAMFEAIAEDPEAGRIVFVEALGGGERMRAARMEAFARFEARVRQYLERVPEDTVAIDVPVVAVAGALRHIVSRHLRTRSEDELPALVGKGLRWLSSYARPAGAQPWSTWVRADFAPTSTPSIPFQLQTMPGRLPPGRHGLPAGQVSRSQHTRILLATAELMMERGYAATRVEDIVSRARVAKPVFYEHFRDKQHAFLEAQHYPTQFILDRCGEAYFSGDHWPQRMWRMLEVLLSLIAANPAVSHLRLVECYSAGREAVRRAEEITRSFTIFLEEGYRYRDEARELPRLFSQAITGAIFEIVQRQVAQGNTAGLSAYLPQLAYVALAPFTGANEAIALVEEMMRHDPA
jgi:AcrR family transcriptional regulator